MGTPTTFFFFGDIFVYFQYLVFKQMHVKKMTDESKCRKSIAFQTVIFLISRHVVALQYQIDSTTTILRGIFMMLLASYQPVASSWSVST